MKLWWIDDEHGGLVLSRLQQLMGDKPIGTVVDLKHVLFQGEEFKRKLQDWGGMDDKSSMHFLVDVYMPKVPGYNIEYKHEYTGVSVAQHLRSLGFERQNIALFSQFSTIARNGLQGDFKLLGKRPSARELVIDWIRERASKQADAGGDNGE